MAAKTPPHAPPVDGVGRIVSGELPGLFAASLTDGEGEQPTRHSLAAAALSRSARFPPARTPRGPAIVALRRSSGP